MLSPKPEEVRSSDNLDRCRVIFEHVNFNMKQPTFNSTAISLTLLTLQSRRACPKVVSCGCTAEPLVINMPTSCLFHRFNAVQRFTHRPVELGNIDAVQVGVRAQHLGTTEVIIVHSTFFSSAVNSRRATSERHADTALTLPALMNHILLLSDLDVALPNVLAKIGAGRKKGNAEVTSPSENLISELD
jgi:hypothetical protein